MRRSRIAILALLPLAASVSACGPVPVDQAEASCQSNARLAERPRGSVTMGAGAGSDGFSGGFGRVELDISSDYLMGRDPAEVYRSCVMRRSGQLPRQPYYSQTGQGGSR